MRVAISNPKPKMAGVTDRGDFCRRISAQISNMRIGVSETDYVRSKLVSSLYNSRDWCGKVARAAMHFQFADWLKK